MLNAEILIVEDELIISADIESILQCNGYTVSGLASTRKEALSMAEMNAPDLVLMDVLLDGELDGIDAAEEIRSRFSIPIIFLTGLTDSKSLNVIIEAMPDDIIFKPYSEKELLTRIQIALKKLKSG